MYWYQCSRTKVNSTTSTIRNIFICKNKYSKTSENNEKYPFYWLWVWNKDWLTDFTRVILQVPIWLVVWYNTLILLVYYTHFCSIQHKYEIFIFRHCLKWDNGPKNDFEKYLIYEAKISQQLLYMQTLCHNFFRQVWYCEQQYVFMPRKGACF